MTQLVSKDFKFQTFPKIASLPDEPKAAALKRYGAVMTLLGKMEVCIRNNRRVRRLRSGIPRSMLTR